MASEINNSWHGGSVEIVPYCLTVIYAPLLYMLYTSLHVLQGNLYNSYHRRQLGAPFSLLAYLHYTTISALV